MLASVLVRFGTRTDTIVQEICVCIIELAAIRIRLRLVELADKRAVRSRGARVGAADWSSTHGCVFFGARSLRYRYGSGGSRLLTT